MENENKNWTDEIKDRLEKIQKLCDYGCDLHTYLMGDGSCNCINRKKNILLLATEIIKISRSFYVEVTENDQVDLLSFEKKVTDWQDKNFNNHHPIPIINNIKAVMQKLDDNSYHTGNTFDEENIMLSQCITELEKTIGYRNLLGTVEEIGELSHAQLKGEQGIRHTPEEILEKKKDAIGDVIIYLINYCNGQGFTLTECINLAWNEVKDRDWTKNKLTGK